MAVYEEFTDYTIRAWLQEPIHLPEEGRATVAQRIRETPQQRHWWPARPARRSHSMFTAFKFAVATVILAVLGGLVFSGSLSGPSAPDPVPGAVESATPSPATQASLPPAIATQVRELEASLPDGWALPLVVREAVTESRVEAAGAAVTLAAIVLANLQEADRFVPEVDLLQLVRARWEAARTPEELEDISDWTQRLPAGAAEVVGPLRELSEALPDGWTFPRVVNLALADQRFDDVSSAVQAAADAIAALTVADAEAAGERVLETYRDQFEGASSVEALQALTAAVSGGTSDAATEAPSPAPTLSPEPEQTPSSLAAEDAARPYDWQDQGLRFEADAIRIRTNGKTFKGRSSPDHVGGGYSPLALPDEGYLEAFWIEKGKEMRLSFELATDGSLWWVTRIRTYDDTSGGRWIDYDDLERRTRTPIGQSYVGDLDLRATGPANSVTAKKARLRIKGLRLTAFAPGTRPAPLTGCRALTADDGVLPKGSGARVEYFAKGALLEGVDELGPAEADQRLTELGICHEFRYQYPFPKKDWGFGYSERWCSMPPVVALDDRRSSIGVSGDRIVRIIVEDQEPRERREQPPAGWNCPTY